MAFFMTLPWKANPYLQQGTTAQTPTNNIWQVGGNDHTFDGCYRPPFARTPTDYVSHIVMHVRTDALGQSGRHTPPTNEEASALVTQRRPNANTIHAAVRHA